MPAMLSRCDRFIISGKMSCVICKLINVSTYPSPDVYFHYESSATIMPIQPIENEPGLHAHTFFRAPLSIVRFRKIILTARICCIYLIIPALTLAQTCGGMMQSITYDTAFYSTGGDGYANDFVQVFP